MITSIIILASCILTVELLGLCLTYQAWQCNGRKHNDYTMIMKNTLLALPIMYVFLVLVLTLA